MTDPEPRLRAQTLNILAGLALGAAGLGVVGLSVVMQGLPRWVTVLGAFAVFAAAYLIFESTVLRLFRNGFVRSLIMVAIGLFLAVYLFGEDITWAPVR